MLTSATLDRPVRLLRPETAPRATPSSLARLPCGTCRVSALCLPGGIGQDDLRPLESLQLTTRRYLAGQAIYAEGDPFRFIHAVRRGTCKTTLSTSDGYEQVAGFHMAGEVMGLEGLARGLHTTTATALEDVEACQIPYRRLLALSARAAPGSKDLLTHLMGQEMLRHHSLMVLLALTEATDRLAAFLLNLSQRHAARGYSPREFHLRMSRGEIASFLGVKVETISRTLGLFQRRGFIEVHGRHVRITDLDGLQRAYDLRLR